VKADGDRGPAAGQWLTEREPGPQRVRTSRLSIVVNVWRRLDGYAKLYLCMLVAVVAVTVAGAAVAVVAAAREPSEPASPRIKSDATVSYFNGAAVCQKAVPKYPGYHREDFVEAVRDAARREGADVDESARGCADALNYLGVP
jgi:hypothetical protein